LLRRLAPGLVAILFAAFPLISLLEHNQTELELTVLWVPLAFTVAGAAAVFGLLLAVLKDGAKAGALTALVALALFYYGTFASAFGLADRWFFPLWALAFVVLAVVLVRTRRDLDNLALVLGAAAVVLVGDTSGPDRDLPGEPPRDLRLEPAPLAGASLPAGQARPGHLRPRSRRLRPPGRPQALLSLRRRPLPR
jgi:hypothetical protein